MSGLAAIDGVALHTALERPDPTTLRQRACFELLRQAAQCAGLLAADDPAPEDGVPTEAAAAAVDALLERELAQPEPGEDACRRYYHAAHAARFARGERIRLRHLLFAVTPGVDLNALRHSAPRPACSTCAAAPRPSPSRRARCPTARARSRAANSAG
jgi:peptidyl-prolyl cis-trans isomerase C